MVRALLISLLFAGAGAAQEAPVSDRPSPGHSTPYPAERDPQVAVQEEFDAAKAVGTVERWDLFLRRHPGNTLAEAARTERARLAGGQ